MRPISLGWGRHLFYAAKRGAGKTTQGNRLRRSNPLCHPFLKRQDIFLIRYIMERKTPFILSKSVLLKAFPHHTAFFKLVSSRFQMTRAHRPGSAALWRAAAAPYFILPLSAYHSCRGAVPFRFIVPAVRWMEDRPHGIHGEPFIRAWSLRGISMSAFLMLYGIDVSENLA